MARTAPASIRANNPGNIKNYFDYEGTCGSTKVTHGTNPVFKTPVYGARAMAKNIEAKFDGRASNTYELLHVLSPTSENNTDGYAIPSVVQYMKNNGYPDFNQNTNIVDSFKYDQRFGTTYMQAIANMEQAGALNSFSKEILQYGWESKNKTEPNYDPYKFGTNADKGFAGCDQQSGDGNPNDPEENPNSPLGPKGSSSSYFGSGSGGASGGGGEYGFKDPEGEFVREEYENKPTTNEAARDQRETKLKVPDIPEAVTEEVKEKIKEMLDTPSEYPKNVVYETPSGHRTEYDDTAKAPKTTWTHSEGAGIEMHKEGDVLEVAPGKSIKVVGNGFALSVTGNGEMVFDGNLDITVTGDFNINCANFTVNTSGSMIEEIGDRKSTTAQNNIGMNAIKGNISEIAKENHVTSSKNKYALVGEDITSVSKDHNIFTSNNIDIKANNNTKIASKQNTDIIGKKMNVVGPEGTFGGENVVMYANTAHTDVQGNVKGDVQGNVKGNVEGDLTGTALVSQVAGGFIIGAPPISRSEAQEAQNTETAKPTSSNISDALDNTDMGVKNAQVDAETIEATSEAPIPSERPDAPDSPEETYDEGRSSSVEGDTIKGESVAGAENGRPGVLSEATYDAGSDDGVPRNTLPRQYIVDAVNDAAVANGEVVQMTGQGGWIDNKFSTSKRTSDNHHSGYAMDFVIPGVSYYEAPARYNAIVDTLAKNAAERGVNVGIGYYSWGIHYDETPTRVGAADPVTSWPTGGRR